MKLVTLFAICLSLTAIRLSGQALTGPVLEKAGATYLVPDPDFGADPDREYKVVFDIASSPDDPAQLNPAINTVARFLNMHARAGVPADHMKVVFVVHGGAYKDVYTDEVYRAKFGSANPNTLLLTELDRAGVGMYICGQTAARRKIAPEEMIPEMGTALSAMTVLVTLQAEGYALISF